jgi:tetratricopeptide (TPR) repeat protein
MLATLSRRTGHFLTLLVIAVAVWAIYANTMSVPFTFDDHPNITRGEALHITTLDTASLKGVLTGAHAERRPVANLTFALNYLVGQKTTLGYHVVNTTIHMIAGWLVYMLAWLTIGLAQPTTTDKTTDRERNDQWYRTGGLAATVALLWVAHPIQTQSVTYIVQRMTSLATMFYLLALCLYIVGRKTRSKPLRVYCFAGVAAAWLLALGSKEITIVLPFTIFLYEWFFFRNLKLAWTRSGTEPSKRRWLIPATVILVVTGIGVLVYTSGNPFGAITGGNRDIAAGQRVMTEWRVVVLYITLMLWPHLNRLNLDYQFEVSTSLFSPFSTVLSLLAILLWIGAAAAIAKRQRVVAFGMLWFMLHLVLESTALNLELVYEHRLYLPSVGFILAFVYGISLLCREVGSRLAYRIDLLWATLAVACVVLLGVTAYQRNIVWQTHATLWQDCANKSPDKFRPWLNAGLAWRGKGEIETALHCFKRAASMPGPKLHEIHNNIGVTLMALERPGEAADHFQQALVFDSTYAMAHNHLGIVRRKQGRVDEAIVYYRDALKHDPDYINAYKNLGIALHVTQSFEDAADQFRKALQRNPKFADAHYRLGLVLIDQEQWDDAIRHLEEGYRLKPSLTSALRHIERARQKQQGGQAATTTPAPPSGEADRALGDNALGAGNLAAAINYYRAALQGNLSEPALVHNNLGAALGQSGKVTEARVHFAKAIELDPDYVEARQNLEAVDKILE